MTKSSVCSVYADLTKLLGDINKFLEEQINSGSIKAEALNQALKIIDRSKYQIERIDGITPQNDDYVVMHNNVIETDDIEEDDHYALVVESIKKCDVADLPAFEIPRSLHVKSGPLTYYKKTDRWFFKREHYIKVFGAVFEEHLLIYKTERSEKPLFCLNLLTYKAHELNNSKKCGAFEVTNRIQNFNFIARNEKDMEQWLSKINKFDCEQECQLERPRPPVIAVKPKKQLQMQKRPIPDIPIPPRKNSDSSIAYVNSDAEENENSTYAQPSDEQAFYYVPNHEGVQENNSEKIGYQYNAYSAVAEDDKKFEEKEEEDEDDEKIYAVVVPPPVPDVPLSFVHRQSSKR